MDHRDLRLKDREHRLRAAIEALKARTPPGEKPPDAVIPAWDGKGGLICPKCGGTCRTPTSWNPWNGRDERMVLVAGKVNNCPHCEVPHFVTDELARIHNAFLFPEDYPEPRKKKREDS